jgi:hypothetical protein
MDEEARAHRKRELEERRRKLEALKAQNATRSKENAERLRREKTSKEEAERKLIQTIIKEVPIHNNENVPVEAPAKVESVSAPRLLEMQAGLAEVSIQAIPRDTYSQSTQTETETEDEVGELPDVLSALKSPKSPYKEDGVSPSRSGISPRSSMSSLRSRMLSPVSPLHETPTKNSIMKECADDEQYDYSQHDHQMKLTEPEIQELLSSDELISFVTKKSTILERALGEALIFDPTQEFVSLHPGSSTSSSSSSASDTKDNDKNKEASSSSQRKDKSFDKSSSNSLMKLTTVLDGSSHWGKYA